MTPYAWVTGHLSDFLRRPERFSGLLQEVWLALRPLVFCGILGWIIRLETGLLVGSEAGFILSQLYGAGVLQACIVEGIFLFTLPVILQEISASQEARLVAAG